jgi:hypothetical protein
MAKYIKGKDGKFVGSIGAGKTNTPKAQPPIGNLSDIIERLKTDKGTPERMSPTEIEYLRWQDQRWGGILNGLEDDDRTLLQTWDIITATRIRKMADATHSTISSTIRSYEKGDW